MFCGLFNIKPIVYSSQYSSVPIKANNLTIHMPLETCYISTAECFIFYSRSPLWYLQWNVLYEFQTTFLDDSFSVEHAREYGHSHLSEVLFYYAIIWDTPNLFIQRRKYMLILVFTVKFVFGNAVGKPVWESWKQGYSTHSFFCTLYFRGWALGWYLTIVSVLSI